MKTEFLETLPVAMAITDSDGCAEFTNSAFRKLMFSPAGNRIDPIFSQLQPPWSLVVRQVLNRSSNGQHSQVLRIDNKWFRITGKPLSINSKNRSRTAIIIEDQTELSSHLTNLDRNKIDEILFHIRSPLTAMHCALTILSEHDKYKPPREQIEAILQIVQDETDRANIFLNNLSALLFIDASKVSQWLELKPISIQETVNYSCRIMRRFARLRNVRIRLVSDNDDDLTDILCDEEFLIKILQNLIANAVIYSPANSTVTVMIREEIEIIRISIVDEGTGIEEEEMDSIFERFVRGSAARNGEITGFGLGLYVARQLVEAMNGSIHAISYPGRGSQFNIELPLEQLSWHS